MPVQLALLGMHSVNFSIFPSPIRPCEASFAAVGSLLSCRTSLTLSPLSLNPKSVFYPCTPSRVDAVQTQGEDQEGELLAPMFPFPLVKILYSGSGLA